MKPTLLAATLAVLASPAYAQTTVQPGNVQSIPPNAIFVNPTGQDTFVTGGQSVTVNPATPITNNIAVPGGAGAAGAVTNNSTVTMRYPRLAASAIAPPVASIGACPGEGWSFALQAFFAGLGFGHTGKPNDACQLVQMGDAATARELLCIQDGEAGEKVRRAAAAAGRPCAQDRQQVASNTGGAIAQPVAVATVAPSAAGYPLYCSHMTPAEQQARGYGAICAAGYPEPVLIPYGDGMPRRPRSRR